MDAKETNAKEVGELVNVELTPVKKESDLTTEIIYQQLSLSRSLEMRAGFYQTLLTYIKQITPNEINLEVSKSFKSELASVLEGFVRVLRGGDSQAIKDAQALELEELRKTLAEAKDKIIVLLTEQAKDRAKIARMETELKFLPDLQSQADRALALVNGAGNLQEELIRLRVELNNAHLSRVRTKLHRSHGQRNWWTRVRAHLRVISDR